METTVIEADEIESFLDLVFGPLADNELDVLSQDVFAQFAEAIATEEPRFDIRDIHDAMQHLDKARVQPRFRGEEQVDTPLGSACRYAHPKNHRPSCIVGHIINYLEPIYFYLIGDSSAGVHAPPRLLEVFTPRAEELLRRMQFHADAGKTWGDAYLEAAVDRLDAVGI